jgi:hypothetical protein
MAITDGFGEGIAELEPIFTAFASCAGSGTRNGALSDPTGISGGATTTTSVLDGSGEQLDALAGTYTACAS